MVLAWKGCVSPEPPTQAGSLCTLKGAAAPKPKVHEDSAQGFNPGNRPQGTRPEGAADRTY